MGGRADLHTHTTYSDGTLSPYELLQKAARTGLAIVGVTDHDTVSAIEEAAAAGKEFGVEVVPGTELSATLDNNEIHILGYYVDIHHQGLLDALAFFRESRLRRVERIVDKLNQMNIPLTVESVLANATGESVGRPHIATALVNGGHASTYHQAFHKYIGNGRPAYEKKAEFSPEETIRLINEAGGLSFLAHPGRSVSEEVTIRLIRAGLDGIEVIHPSHSPDLVQYYRGIVNEYCLLESGGSDFHGGMKNDDHLFGQVAIPIAAVEVMKRRLLPN
jgi:predicted metal-dependent phosphoesterase TrpH